MIELTKHIEILLLENDCVIVPGLGGFIAHHQPAHYEEDEGVFLPPTRTVGFNPQLTMNDGLLTQAYMQTYHTDFPDASRKIAQKVDELKEMLYSEGMVEMPGIGSLHYTIYNTYEFHPQISGVLSPTLYGLDAYTISPLAMAPLSEVPVERKKKEFRLNPQWLSNAVAVVIAAVLFFALSFPVENTYVDKGVYASLGTDCLFDAIRSHSMATSLVMQEVEEPQKQKTSPVVPVVVKVEKVAPVAKAEVQVQKVETSVKETVKVETPKVVEVPKVKEVPAPVKVKAEPKKMMEPKKEAQKAVVKKKNYHIIVASLTTMSDANRMLKQYQQQGYSDAVVKENNGRFRISLCSYADKSVAYQKLNELKKADAFKGAWMLTSK